KRRRELHARIGLEMEALYGERSTDMAEDLAHHYLLGERWLAAARWGLLAAHSARKLYSLPEALELGEVALNAIDTYFTEAGGVPRGQENVEPAHPEPLRLKAQILTALVELGLLMRLHEEPQERP